MKNLVTHCILKQLFIGVLFLFLQLFFIEGISAQNKIVCGTANSNQEGRQWLDDWYHQWLQGGNTSDTGKINIIPIAFHIVRHDDGITGNVTVQQIYSQINILNSAFSNSNTDFRFSLYSIDSVNNTLWATGSGEGGLIEMAMKNSLAKDVVHYLNFYITDLGGGMDGYSYYSPRSQAPLGNGRQ
jgi:hypothetical protein